MHSKKYKVDFKKSTFQNWKRSTLYITSLIACYWSFSTAILREMIFSPFDQYSRRSIANNRLIFKQGNLNGVKKLTLSVIFLFWIQSVFAHSINYALEGAPVNEVVWFYLKLGFEHIIPAGVDHILFVVGLCLLSTNIKTIIWQATAFTVAHSITLALSMKNVIVAPGAIVEPIIALSILFVAIENLLLTELKPWRIAIVFIFGLIHGMGFASALNEIGLPAGKFYTSVIAFNVGVELGQIAVITAMFACIIFPLRNKSWYRKGVVFPLSILIAIIALYWTIQRIFFTGI